MRCGMAQHNSIDAALDSGEVVRTHVMRPTWHLVAREDIRWLLHLTAPRLQLVLPGRIRALGFEARDVARAIDVMTDAISSNGAMTRRELAAALSSSGLRSDAGAMILLLFAAEVDQRIISGPRRDRQFTYALFDDRVPRVADIALDDARRELAVRYVRSHGPATATDFAWWSGMTLRDARRAFEAAASALRRQDIDGVTYWMHRDSETVRLRQSVHLLPNFDEYTVGYRERTLLHGAGFVDPSRFAYGLLSNVVLVGGRVRGAWRRTQAGRAVVVEVRCAVAVPAAVRDGVQRAARQYAEHLGTTVTLRWS
jgi:DNA glycosylase AlkZ-like